MKEINLKMAFQEDEDFLKFLDSLDDLRKDSAFLYEITKSRKRKNGKHSTTPKKAE